MPALVKKWTLFATVIMTLNATTVQPDPEFRIWFDAADLMKECANDQKNRESVDPYKNCVDLLATKKVDEECKNEDSQLPDCVEKKKPLADAAAEAAKEAGALILECTEEQCVKERKAAAAQILEPKGNCQRFCPAAKSAIRKLLDCSNKQNKPARCKPAPPTTAAPPTSTAKPVSRVYTSRYPGGQIGTKPQAKITQGEKSMTPVPVDSSNESNDVEGSPTTSTATNSPLIPLFILLVYLLHRSFY